jgi:hypothetical protein
VAGAAGGTGGGETVGADAQKEGGMNTEAFDKVVERRVARIQTTLTRKAKEYAIGDRLYNFKRAATILRTSPQQALAGMFMKHLVSVLDLIEGSVENTGEMVDEKIGDAINYLVLLEAIFKEQRDEAAAVKCLECAECSNGDPS